MYHLEIKHPIYKQKDVSFFQWLPSDPNVASYVFSTNKGMRIRLKHRTEYVFVLGITDKNHTIAKNLIYPCIENAVQCMVDGKKLKYLFLKLKCPHASLVV